MAWVDMMIITVISLLELFSILTVITSFADKRREGHIWANLAVYAAVGGGIVFINFYGLPKILLAVCYAVIVVKLYRRYLFTLVESIIYVVVVTVGIGILELVIYVPIQLLAGAILPDKGVSVLVVGVVLCICLYIRKKRKLLFLKKLVKDRDRALFVVFLIVVIAAFAALFFFHSRRGMSFWEGLCLVLAAGAVIYATYKVAAYRHEIKFQKDYSEAYGNVVETIRSRQHKFMNHLDAIYALHTIYNDYDELVQKQGEELNKLQQYMMPNKILILENPLVAAHVYQKMCEAKERGIDLQLNLSCSIQQIPVPEIYLIEIIGNVLDNAMDEVETRGLHEIIYLSVFREDAGVSIHICNEHDKIPYSVYSRFFTVGYSSKGTDRGLGLPYVKKIVQKYNGFIDIGNTQIAGKNCFSVKVTLPESE